MYLVVHSAQTEHRGQLEPNRRSVSGPGTRIEVEPFIFPLHSVSGNFHKDPHETFSPLGVQQGTVFGLVWNRLSVLHPRHVRTRHRVLRLEVQVLIFTFSNSLNFGGKRLLYLVLKLFDCVNGKMPGDTPPSSQKPWKFFFFAMEEGQGGILILHPMSKDTSLMMIRRKQTGYK